MAAPVLGDSLVGAALAVAATDWIAVARGAKGAEYVLKPLTLGLFVAAAVTYRRPGLPTERWVFTVAALALSLAGDVLLMLPRDMFVAGLGSFFLAHVAYVAAFNPTPPPFATSSVAAAAVLALAVPLYARMAAGIVRRGHRELLVPVAIYVVGIGAMVVSAAATLGRPDWMAEARGLVLVGAVLFLASDALIGWTRFVREIRGGRLVIIVTYHIGQACLVLGVLAVLPHT